MIGRGAYGAPWLPGQIAAALRSGAEAIDLLPLDEQRAVAVAHVDAMLSHYGTHLGLKNARKHVGWYLETSGANAVDVKAWRRKLCTEDNATMLLAGLADFYRSHGRSRPISEPVRAQAAA
jgi:tRNA-dihydrouridine synthase B